jgi:hypothetical protein
MAGPDDRFCASCGNSLEGISAGPPAARFCTRCGGPLAEDDRFCGRCGARSGPDLPGDDTQMWGLGDEEDEDLLADWDLADEDLVEEQEDEPAAPPGDEAQTQTIARPEPRPGDTAILPRPEPFLTPGGEAPPEPPAPAPTPAPYRPSQAPPPRTTGFPLGATFALLGAVAVVVSSLLDWGAGDLAGTLPGDLPVRALVDADAAGGPSLGLVLLIAGTIGALVALLTMLVPGLKFVRRLIGLVTLGAPVVFVIRLVLVPLLGQGEAGQALDLIGVGVYVAAAGAILQIVSGKWFSR